MAAIDDAAAPLETLLLIAPDQPFPAWAEQLPARPIPLPVLEGRAAAALLHHAGCVIVSADAPGFVAAARRVHALDASVQLVAVASPETVAAARRTLIYSPGLGEVWIASPDEISAALQERATGVTRQRRRFERTRARIESERITLSPQRTERALISDAYLAGLLQVLPDAVFSVEASGRVLSANAAAERLFGGGPRVVGRLLTTVLRLDDAPADDPELLRRAVGEGQLEVTFHTPAGERRTGALRATSMRVRDDLEVWSVALRDITDEHATLEQLRDSTTELEATNEELQSTTEELLQRTEEAERAAAALRDSEESFRALADAIPTLAWTARPDGYIDWYNRRWYEYTGTTPAQMEGWGWQSVHDPVVLPQVVARWTASVRSGRPFEMTFPLRGADGVFRAFLTRIVPVRDGTGRIIRWFGTNTDVEAEHANRLRIERLQAVTEALAATRTLDDVAHVVVANAVRATEARTGMLIVRVPASEEATLVSQTGLPDTVAERLRRLRPSSKGPAAECLLTGEPVFVATREGPDGLFARFPAIAELWASLGTEAIATVPLVAGAEVVGVMSFTFDRPRRFSPDDRAFFLALARQCAQAVERARLFAAEREARERADDANRAKSQFLANMSHELRTPLNAIAGYVQLLEMELQGPIAPAQRESLARVRRAQEHLLGLINDVLNFAKIESGRVDYQMEAVDADAIVADVVSLMAPQFASRGLAFETRVARDDGAAPRVWADRDKVRQVLLNLLSNAVKFTEPGGRVAIEVAGDGTERVALRVTDTGSGIPADRLESIFEPFVQVRAQYNSRHEGTGLGLAISRDLARGMKGDLTVESRVGEGSTFTLWLRSGRAAPEASTSA